MELQSPLISKTPQLFSSFSSFTPQLSIKTSYRKPLHRFHISEYRKISLFPRCCSTVFHVSAHFGRPASRRNSLRKKLLLDHQKVRQNPITLNPTLDFQNPNGSFENFKNLNNGSTKQSCRHLILFGLFCLFSFLGLGPICDKFRIWASNLVRFYFIESSSRFCINCLFGVYFVFNRHLSLNVMLCRFVSSHVFSYLFTLNVVLFV